MPWKVFCNSWRGEEGERECETERERESSTIRATCYGVEPRRGPNDARLDCAQPAEVEEEREGGRRWSYVSYSLNSLKGAI